MDDLSAAARSNRILALKGKLKAREGNPAFRENCKALREEISRLENLSAAANLGSEETGSDD